MPAWVLRFVFFSDLILIYVTHDTLHFDLPNCQSCLRIIHTTLSMLHRDVIQLILSTLCQHLLDD